MVGFLNDQFYCLLSIFLSFLVCFNEYYYYSLKKEGKSWRKKKRNREIREGRGEGRRKEGRKGGRREERMEDGRKGKSEAGQWLSSPTPTSLTHLQSLFTPFPLLKLFPNPENLRMSYAGQVKLGTYLALWAHRQPIWWMNTHRAWIRIHTLNKDPSKAL